MTILSPHVVGAKIAEALKLDLKYIKRISLDFDVDSIAVCCVEFYPDLTQIDAITQTLETAMKTYALCELKTNDDNHIE
jgi:hypothetical protein